MVKAGLASLSFVLVVGCASHVPRNSYYDDKQGGDDGKALTDNQKKAALKESSDAYDGAIRYCRDIMEKKRKHLSGERNISVAIASVGILAGSIVVPGLAAQAAAAKSAIAAWGGVSGAANAGQYMLDSNGLSPYQAVVVYNQMKTDIRAAMAEFNAAGNDTQKRAAAVDSLIAACAFEPVAGAKQPEAPTPPSPES